SFGHDQVEWFRVAQLAIPLYDVNHARKAGDVYKEHQMDLEDWCISMQGGTNYQTLPLVLPTTYGLIEAMAPRAPLVHNLPGVEAAYELSPDKMHPGGLAAPHLCDCLSPTSVLQNLYFIDAFDLISTRERDWALRELRNEWTTSYNQGPKSTTPEAQARPTDDAAVASVQPAQAVPAVNEQPTKERKMEDELEQYLDDPEEPNLDIKVLDC
ncbi:MAG: hypothetical protein SGPRY_011060, partial [Prymnesium sp.]